MDFFFFFSDGILFQESTSLAVPGVTIPLSNFTQTSTLTVNAHNGATQNASAPQQPPLLFAEKASNLSKSSTSDATVERIKLNYIDLNHVYDDSQDCMDDPQNNFAPENVGCTSTVLHSQRFSTPHNSLGSSPSQSPSSSSGEAQVSTCFFHVAYSITSSYRMNLELKIVFGLWHKLFYLK